MIEPFLLSSNYLFLVFGGLVGIVDLVYLYYWINVLYALKHKHIKREKITEKQLLQSIIHAANQKNPTNFIIQITTKGGATSVMKRGIDNVLETIRMYPVLQKHLSVEIITEELMDVKYLNDRYKNAEIKVSTFLLPTDYTTPNNTQFKAKSLHYMVEYHRNHPDDNAYIVHYDEESVFNPQNLVRLVYSLTTKPVDMSEGAISYGNDWMEANIFCRAMESSRPFSCHECYTVMTNPPPYHLHGSNLIVKQSLENEIGWDIGLLDGNAIVAEDLVFGLQAYIKYGKRVFGWHSAEMVEQPPFKVKDAIRRRNCWVFGSLQALSLAKKMPEWQELSFIDKLKINCGVLSRIITFVLGFPVSIFSLIVNSYLLGIIILDAFTTQQLLQPDPLAIVLVPGLFLWLGSTQLGLYYNLRYSNLNKAEKIIEHIKILLITPFSGTVETYGAFCAYLKWISGRRETVWIPTPKLYKIITKENIEPQAKLALEKSYK